MILQALHEYYGRKMADLDPARRLPAFGLEDKEICFILEITTDGRLKGITDTRRLEGKRAVGASYLVPAGVKKTSGVAANLLWDSAGYALGVDTKDDSERARREHAAFRARIDALPLGVQGDVGVAAVRAFLDHGPLAAVAADPLWEEIRTRNPAITFRMEGEQDLVCQHPAILRHVLTTRTDDGEPPQEKAICLVTGEFSPVERLHRPIKGVWHAQSSGANMVSFNLDAFNSFVKHQGLNAPVSTFAAFAYTTALNHLLARDSRQRLQVGDSSTVFWSQKSEDSDVEDVFAEVFGERADPDAQAEQVRALFAAVQTGRFDGARGNGQFYVLGLAPNAARVAVRFWHAAPLRTIARRIREWFEDLTIIRGLNDPEYPSLFRLLTAVAVQGKADNIPARLGGDLMRSILVGSVFPALWLNAAVQRSRAEQTVTYYRAAAIKAYLNRAMRSKQEAKEREITAMLDTANPSVPYRLGRLFAVLEKAQEEATPGLNSTIRERYYGAASSTPVTVFTTLLRLKNHHLAKLDNRGRAVNLEKLIGEILDGIDALPAHLGLPEQGRFAIGYYHQRQSFFAKPADL